MPAPLKELMRHESIETTLRFSVSADAQTKADAAWAAYEPVSYTHLTLPTNREV